MELTHAPAPTPITLVFSPTFGAYHEFGKAKERKRVEFIVDPGLAGRIVRLNTERKCYEFSIGRSEECLVQVNGARDENGYPLLNGFRRKHITMVWMNLGDSRDSHWDWVVITGGVFVKDGGRESAPKSLVWINGNRLDPNNPEPLFQSGLQFAKIALGKHGRIIVERGTLSADATQYPPEAWEGDGWPETQDIDLESTIPGDARKQVEDQIQAYSGSTWADFGRTALDRLNTIPLPRLLIIVATILGIVVLKFVLD